jgi:hypothetical protein
MIFAVVLLVFHLYLLARWEKVRRAGFYLLGCAGLVVIFLGNFFLIGGSSRVGAVGELFYCLGLLPALVGAVGSCFPGELPVITVSPSRRATPSSPSSVSVEKL